MVQPKFGDIFNPPDRELRKSRIMLLWPPSLTERVKALANEHGMSLNELVLRVMERTVPALNAIDADIRRDEATAATTGEKAPVTDPSEKESHAA